MKCRLSSFYVHAQQLQTIEAELRNFINKVTYSKSLEDIKALSTVRNKALQLLKTIPRNPRFLPYVKSVIATINEATQLLEMKKREAFEANNSLGAVET